MNPKGFPGAGLLAAPSSEQVSSQEIVYVTVTTLLLVEPASTSAAAVVINPKANGVFGGSSSAAKVAITTSSEAPQSTSYGLFHPPSTLVAAGVQRSSSAQAAPQATPSTTPVRSQTSAAVPSSHYTSDTAATTTSELIFGSQSTLVAAGVSSSSTAQVAIPTNTAASHSQAIGPSTSSTASLSLAAAAAASASSASTASLGVAHASPSSAASNSESVLPVGASFTSSPGASITGQLTNAQGQSSQQGTSSSTLLSLSGSNTSSAGSPRSSTSTSSSSPNTNGGNLKQKTPLALFGKSSGSIALSVFVLLIILAILTCTSCFFGRRYLRQRRRKTRGNCLYSIDGSPEAMEWTEKDIQERVSGGRGSRHARTLSGISEETESGIHPAAAYADRISKTRGIPVGYTEHASSMRSPDSSVRRASSDWTSFIGEKTWSEAEGDRRGSSGTLASNASSRIAPGSKRKPAPAISTLDPIPAVPSKVKSHPLRSYFIPTYASSSAYSGGEDSDESPPLSPLQWMYGADAEVIQTPVVPGSWRWTLDRVMTSATEYLGNKFGDLDDRSERGEGHDRFTSFTKSADRADRRTLLSPISIAPNRFDGASPAYPVRSATLPSRRTTDPVRRKMVETDLTPKHMALHRSISDAAARASKTNFLAVQYQGQIAQGARDRMIFPSLEERRDSNATIGSAARSVMDATGSESDIALASQFPLPPSPTGLEVPHPSSTLFSSPNPFADPAPSFSAGHESLNIANSYSPKTAATHSPGLDQPVNLHVPSRRLLLYRRTGSSGSSGSSTARVPRGGSTRRPSSASIFSSHSNRSVRTSREVHRALAESRAKAAAVISKRSKSIRSKSSCSDTSVSESEEEDPSSGGSSEDSNGSAGRRPSKVLLQQRELARLLLNERRRRSEGEVIRRVSVVSLV